MFRSPLRFLAAYAALALSPLAAAAQDHTCDELWFTRNLQFHLAGYCFGSTLGQEVFGNDACTGTDVALSSEAKALVDRIRANEAAMGCAVDTSRTMLSMDVLEMDRRMLLRHQPVAYEGESGCIGWTGAPVRIMSGHSGEGSRRGTVEPGDSLVFGHEAEGPWEFVTVYSGTEDWVFKTIGWVALGDWGNGMCDMYAG